MRKLMGLLAALLPAVALAQTPVEAPEMLLPPTPPPEMPLLLPLRENPADSYFTRRTLGGSPGWYFDLELAVLVPNLRTRESNDGLFGRGNDFDVDANVATTFTFGYAVNDVSTFLFSYRYFGTDGVLHADNEFFGDAQTRLDINEFNWTFQRRLRLPWDGLRLAGEFGARLTSVYYDVTAKVQLPTFAPDDSMYQLCVRGSSQFVGAGPTIGVAGDYDLRQGLSLFGRTDFAALFGRQTFRYAVHTMIPGQDDYFASDSMHEHNTLKVLRAAAGINWAPANTPHMTFQFGYQFEYWWDVGSFGDSHDDLMLNGAFARVHFKY